MANIAIMTDSDSSIPADVAERLDIAQAPISIQFGEESYDAGVTIDDKALFERVTGWENCRQQRRQLQASTPMHSRRRSIPAPSP